MNKYIKQIINSFPEKMSTSATTPASDHLFETIHDDICKALPEEQTRLFNHFVVQLLFLLTRVRHDIKTVVTFLTTHILLTDDDDWEKLHQVIHYLLVMPYLGLMLEADSINFVIN